MYEELVQECLLLKTGKVRLELLKKCGLILDEGIALVDSEVFLVLLHIDVGRFIGSPYPVAGGLSMDDNVPFFWIVGQPSSSFSGFTLRSPCKVGFILTYTMKIASTSVQNYLYFNAKQVGHITFIRPFSSI